MSFKPHGHAEQDKDWDSTAHNVQEAQKLQDSNMLKHQAYAIMCLEYYVLEACTVRHSIARGFALAWVHPSVFIPVCLWSTTQHEESRGKSEDWGKAIQKSET